MLAVLDTRQERAQLAAAEAQRDLSRVNFDRMQGLLDERVVSRAEFDQATADQRQAEREGRRNRARRSSARRFARRFQACSASARSTSASTCPRGDALVTLQSLNPIYVNFGVPQQAMARYAPGRVVRIAAGDRSGSAARTAAITAIDSVVDESTRNMQVAGDGRRTRRRTLRPGMFVQTEVVVGASADGHRVAGDRRSAMRRTAIRCSSSPT